jgi:ABC-type phosphate/phosphonate transport system permease subunit
MDENQKPSQQDLKKKLNILSIIFYIIFFIWVVFLGLIIFKLISGEETSSLFIGTIPIIAVLIILSQIKSKIRKEIKS